MPNATIHEGVESINGRVYTSTLDAFPSSEAFTTISATTSKPQPPPPHLHQTTPRLLTPPRLRSHFLGTQPIFTLQAEDESENERNNYEKEQSWKIETSSNEK